MTMFTTTQNKTAESLNIDTILIVGLKGPINEKVEVEGSKLYCYSSPTPVLYWINAFIRRKKYKQYKVLYAQYGLEAGDSVQC